MGQLVEWPEVVTEGRDLEDCRAMLRDALNEMVLAYQQMGKEIPLGNALLEQFLSNATNNLTESLPTKSVNKPAPNRNFKDLS